MKEGIKTIAILAICLGVVWGIFYGMRQSQKIPENDINLRGNTPSNAYNSGLFCEGSDGIVYFSNSYDNGALYSMNPDETDLKKLNKYNTQWINEAGKYLYYYEAADGSNAIAGFGGHMMGIYRSDKKGGKLKCLDKAPCVNLSLAGNYLFYMRYTNVNNEGLTLHKLHIDKKDEEQVMKDFINPSCVLNGNIYYAGLSEDHKLYKLNCVNDSVNVLIDDNMWFPVVTDDERTVYYISVDDGYKLYRTTLGGGEPEKLTDDRIDCYCLAGDYIYYQKANENDMGLMRMRLDGSDSMELLSGVYRMINATSRTVYFKQYGDDYVTYRTDIGSDSVTTFAAAMNAVEETK